MMNYHFQKEEKYLRIFTTIDSIRQMNYQKKNRDLKFVVNSSGLKAGFSELKDPVAFLHSI